MAMRLRALLRASPRMPREDHLRLKTLMRDVAKTPPGDDVLPARLCTALQSAYSQLRPEGRVGFVSLLARQGDVDEHAVSSSCRAVLAAADEGRPSLRAREALREALRPASERVVERLAQQPGGLGFLVGLRADLLAAMDSSAAVPPAADQSSADDSAAAAAERERWRSLDASLRRLLGVWFDAGLLELQRLTMEKTPASLLEKIMSYERVHAIRDWSDLRWRLGGPGRQLFAFLHPRMPGEPLVFVQCCLRTAIPSRLADVLPDQTTTDDGDCDGSGDEKSAASNDDHQRNVAVFYSISSPFIGLRGVPLGRLLIKQVLSTLAAEQPQLDTFVTLSPVPGFRSWLEARLAQRGEAKADEAKALDRLLTALESDGLDASSPFESPLVSEKAAVRDALLSLCARYLCLATKRQRALDPVAGFHLRNGATLLDLHWAANPSPRGLRESAGIMVNYQYRIEAIEENHSAYLATGKISASDSVWRLVGD